MDTCGDARGHGPFRPAPDHGPGGSHGRSRHRALAGALGLTAWLLAADSAVTPPSTLAQAPAAPRLPHAAYLPLVSPPMPAVAALRLSHTRGIYDAPFALEAATTTPGAVIRYTTDGTVPTEAHGEIYGAPLAITTTTVLKILGVRPGFTPTAVETHTYILPAAVVRQPAQPDPRRFPAAWGTYPEDSAVAGFPVPADYAMDPKVVDDPRYRDTILDDLKSLPSLSLVTTPEDMFGSPGLWGTAAGIYSNPLGEGSDWERPMSAELIHADGRPGFQINGGVRIAGQWSRKPDGTPKHSFSLRFRRRYGPTHLVYPLFAGGDVRTFDDLRLRAGQADALHYFAHKAQYVHDQWGRDTQRAMGGLSADGAFVHLYVNGLYWGLYNLTEEPTAAFAEAHLGGDADDFDVLKGAERIVVGPDGQAKVEQTYEIEDGEADAYESLLAIPKRGAASNPELYDQMAAALDIRQHIDFTLLEIYGANHDWLGKNWRALRRRAAGERFRFLVWDIEQMTPLVDLDADCGSRAHPECGDIADTPGVAGLHGWLKGSPEYRFAFADRARRHLFAGGALAPDQARARYRRLAGGIEGAVVGESARWGDAEPQPRTRNEMFAIWSLFWARFGHGAPWTRDDHWARERDRVLDTYFPRRAAIVLQQLCDAGLYPALATPALETRAGRGKSTVVAMRADAGTPRCAGERADGTIYYTTDGSDPRAAWSGDGAVAWTGEPSPSARVYRQPARFTSYAVIKARLAVTEGGHLVWSALVETAVETPRLAFSEIMYHPPPGDPEFLEIQNLEPAPVDLSGATLTGVSATLPPGTVIEPGGFLVLTPDLAAFRGRYSRVPVAATYAGDLADAGETLALGDARGAPLLRVAYDNKAFWPVGPDGYGYALVMVDPAADPADPEHWRSSARRRGSPGGPDPDPPHRLVVVSEVLAHASPPLEGAIELFNPGEGPIDIGGWFLSDTREDLRKYRIHEGTTLAPKGFAVFYAEDLRGGGSFVPPPSGGLRSGEPWIGAGLGLDPRGGMVYLSSGGPLGELTGSIRGVGYGPAEPGVSWGRHRTSVRQVFVPQARRTFGADDAATVEAFRAGTGLPNAGPRIGAAVLGEIMYHPAAGADEYVEIVNRTDAPLVLESETLTAATWRLSAGVGYAFPPGIRIPPRGRIIVAGADPRAFRANSKNARVPDDVVIFGPFEGDLDDEGETVALSWPALIGGDTAIRYIDADRVRYADAAPWPALAAGHGPSLERRGLDRYGDDPLSWLALATVGTPGLPTTIPIQAFFPVAVVAEPDGGP